MGAYVNPGEDKREWLEKNATKTNVEAAAQTFSADGSPNSSIRVVILVDNAFFTSAGIAFDKREFEAFTEPSDSRKKAFYLVDVSKLWDVSNLSQYEKREEMTK